MAASGVPSVPRGTGRAGRRLWLSIVERYELDGQELAVLREAVRTADVLDKLAKVADRDGPMVSSPQGPRVHPAIVEARQARLTLARLIASLRLPADDGSVPQRRGGPRGVYRSDRGLKAVEG